MKENVDRLCSALFNRFNSSHVLLFVGQGMANDDVKDLVSKERWSAIITTKRDEDFAAYFATKDRRPWECVSRQELSGRSLSRERPPIIRLFGKSGDDEDVSEFLLYGPQGRSEGDLARGAGDLLRAIPALLDYTNHLVVAGLSSDEDAKALDILGPLFLKEVTPGSVSFRGMESSLSDKELYKKWVRAISKEMSFEIYDTDLEDVLRYHQEEERASRETAESPSSDDDIFYCDFAPVRIGLDDVLKIKGIGTLLTERTINRIRPLGRNMQRLWFSNFLELSGIDEPQWYGYLPQSDFHVKRDYEDPFVLLVRRALRGQGLGSEPWEDRPIILSGAPCSSKSVTLGALAYRVYNEKADPVLFISGNLFQGSSFGSSFRRLDDALQIIQRSGEGSHPTLVIWDGSSYREIENDAKNLLNRLKNRGRRVILVCSSYSFENDNLSSDGYTYDDANEAFAHTENKKDMLVEVRSECVFFRTTRDMSDREGYVFWQKASNYSGISSEQISFLRNELKREEKPDIFDHYYKLITLLREHLEESLESEQSKVTRFLQSEMADYFTAKSNKEGEDRRSNPMWQAFLKAGMTEEQLMELFDEEDESSENEEERDEWRESIIRANSFIAFFSKYKIDIPYSIVYSVITSRSGENPYGEIGRELFDVLTTDIPWLTCGENEDEEFVFRFRNSLEANIFLERHGIGGDRLVDMAVKVLEFYGESYSKNQFDDPRLAQKLQALIRIMGPNSKYYTEASDEQTGILAHLDKLIDAVGRLLQDYRVPDIDQGFALLYVTLTREYYGDYGRNVWGMIHKRAGGSYDYEAEGYRKEDYELRLTQLNNAAALALRSESHLEQRIGVSENLQERAHLTRQANALIVEATRCSLESDDLRRQYRECCKLCGQSPRTDCIDDPQPYVVQFKKLEGVIRNDPINGFAYNALFTLFEREYESNCHSSDDRIEYLTEIMALVQDCRLLGDEIVNRGDRHNELDDHLVRISSFADEIPASIDYIEGRETLDSREATVFTDIYDKFLEEGNPAAILFVCRKEIKDILDSQENLSELERKRCQKVLDFMREPTRLNCISSDANALATLIRVAWMAFGGKQLSATKECQTPAFSLEQWRELHRYCERYAQKATRGGQQPLFILVYALSTIQIGGKTSDSYDRAYGILRRISEDRFGGQYRLRTPFMVCDEDGKPSHYSGRVRNVKDRYGFMDVNGLPNRFGSSDGIRFYFSNLGRNINTPERGDVFADLEIGISYTEFRIYKEEGRLERGRL